MRRKPAQYAGRCECLPGGTNAQVTAAPVRSEIKVRSAASGDATAQP